MDKMIKFILLLASVSAFLEAAKLDRTVDYLYYSPDGTPGCVQKRQISKPSKQGISMIKLDKILSKPKASANSGGKDKRSNTKHHDLIASDDEKMVDYRYKTNQNRKDLTKSISKDQNGKTTSRSQRKAQSRNLENKSKKGSRSSKSRINSHKDSFPDSIINKKTKTPKNKRSIPNPKKNKKTSKRCEHNLKNNNGNDAKNNGEMAKKNINEKRNDHTKANKKYGKDVTKDRSDKAFNSKSKSISRNNKQALRKNRKNSDAVTKIRPKIKRSLYSEMPKKAKKMDRYHFIEEFETEDNECKDEDVNKEIICLLRIIKGAIYNL
ncbi:hypothetical protein AYI68_g215 [Smittium mucronatum]|uniref:Uncharacterized protein n=1 Tax=Smittium mucronatum TaxID=133383 RepID=A0A1R0H8Z6_9FUNG|nr:hypothetical protein AYI68_g215 [Smittium mucronatum]